jgi:nitroreductase
MTTPPAKNSQDTLDVLYRRRSVRKYTPDVVDKTVVLELLDAAVHAPTARHGEPWSFVVVQDKDLLDRMIKGVKEKAGQGAPVFYNARTVILVCTKNPEPMGIADGWLAAENLMLAACAKGLGSCVIGSALGALDAPEWRAELKIPDGTAIVAPIIVGVPAEEPPVSPRKPPEILLWK